MTSSQKNEPGKSRYSMLPKLAPRSTITSRAREGRNTKGDLLSRTVPSTPVMYLPNLATSHPQPSSKTSSQEHHHQLGAGGAQYQGVKHRPHNISNVPASLGSPSPSTFYPQNSSQEHHHQSGAGGAQHEGGPAIQDSPQHTSNRIEGSRASSVCEVFVKPAFGTKEKKLIPNNEVEPMKYTKEDILISSENIKCSLAETGRGDEEVYMNKQSEFQLLKKDLEERQSAILELYSYLQQLHRKMVGAGREVGLLLPAPQMLDLSQGLQGPQTIGDGLGLPKIIVELPAQLTGVCHEILTSRNAIINCLRVMGTTNEMGEANVASKIREWGVESESLCVLVGTTAQQSEQNAKNISDKVSELVRQAMALNSENNQMKEQLLQLKKDLEQAKKPIGRATVAKRQPGSLIEISSRLSHDGHKRSETEGSCGKEDSKRQLDLERTTRTRIRCLERDLKEINTAYAEQTEIVHSLQSEAKHRETRHESCMRVMRDHVRTAEQKMNAVSEEKDQLRSSAKNAHQEEEILLCSLKDRNAELEICLKEQGEKAANATKEIAEAENIMRNMENKVQCVLDIVKIKGAGLLRNDAELVKECNTLRDKLTSAEENLETLKQENSKDLKEVANLVVSKERYESELATKKLFTLKLNRDIAELKEELSNVSQERDRYLQSLEQKMNENGGPKAPEQLLHQANKLIAAKVEEVRKLRATVASNDQEKQTLEEQIKSQEEHLKIWQLRRDIEENITTGSEYKSATKKRRFYFF